MVKARVKAKYRDSWKTQKVQATLALSYPPGYLLNKQKLFKKGFKMPTNFCKEFGLHGLFEPFWMKTFREEKKEKQEKKKKQKGKIKYESNFSKAFIERLRKAIHYVDEDKAQSIIAKEREKHGTNLTFLTPDEYPVFAVDLFERYHFNEMLSYVFDELKCTQVNVWEYSLYGEDWIGIRLKDLAPICESYSPICGTNTERKLTLRVMECPYADHFVLYELHTGVSVDSELYSCGAVAQKFKEDREDESVSADAIILLCNALNF